MNHFHDIAIPTVIILIGIALTSLDAGPTLIEALGLLAVACGGFWLGRV